MCPLDGLRHAQITSKTLFLGLSVRLFLEMLSICSDDVLPAPTTGKPYPQYLLSGSAVYRQQTAAHLSPYHHMS